MFRAAFRSALRSSFSAAALVLLLPAAAVAQQASGSITANGKSEKVSLAVAYEVDSDTEPGYMDTVVLLANQPVSREVALSDEKLAELTKKGGFVALRVKIDPDAKIKSAAPYHAAFKNFISSGAYATFKPTAYDEKRVAGSFTTNGEQEFMGDKWKYDLTFSASIVLDPAAKSK